MPGLWYLHRTNSPGQPEMPAPDEDQPGTDLIPPNEPTDCPNCGLVFNPKHSTEADFCDYHRYWFCGLQCRIGWCHSASCDLEDYAS